MGAPPIPLIKSNHVDKSSKYFVKIKFRKDQTLSSSDPHEFKMGLFVNGYPEEFLLFMQNFNMTLLVSGTLVMGAKIQYIRTLVCV